MKTKSSRPGPENQIFFYLVKSLPAGRQVPDLKSDFESIASYLGTYGDIQLSRPTEVSISFTYPENQKTAVLKIAPPDKFVLACDRTDNVSVHLLNNVVKNLNYRIYNPKTLAFMVNDPNLLDLTTVQLEPKYFDIFNRFNLAPLYQYRNSLVFFAADPKTGNIYLVNRNLLEHLLEHPADSFKSKDFAVKVADNISQFVALYDRGLIPISYYNTIYQTANIVNHSGFDLDRLGTAVFLAPQFFEFNPAAQTFDRATATGSETRLDRLNVGESIKKYLGNLQSRIYGNRDYLAIKIGRDVSYYKSSPGQVIPGLNVSIFVWPH